MSFEFILLDFYHVFEVKFTISNKSQIKSIRKNSRKTQLRSETIIKLIISTAMAQCSPLASFILENVDLLSVAGVCGVSCKYILIGQPVMQSQKTSFIKRTGQGARREFQLMHLAVFPYQFEFLKNVDFPIVAYFEKGNQIIGVNGNSPIVLQGGSKGERQRVLSENNIIRFHLYSESNVVYKWSIYKRHPNGEQEFLESCAFNLKDVVANYILPHRGEQHSLESVLPNDFHEKPLRGKFVKTAIIVSFALMIATDSSLIDSYVEQQFLTDATKRRNSQNVIDLQNGDVVQRGQQISGQDSFQSASMLSDVVLGNDSKVSHRQQLKEKKGQALVSGIKDISQHQISQPQPNIVIDTIDLDQMILNGTEPQRVENPPKALDDIVFDIDTPRQTPPAQLKVEQNKRLRHSNSRDYSLLKLDSDQGRNSPPQEIDVRLGKEELDLIEEEKHSIKDTAKLSSQLKTPRKGQLLIQAGSADESKSSVIVQGMSFKKIILILLGISLCLLMVATYRYNTKKGRPRSRGK